mmetsp:Transcript_5528/g.12062  ORF Transcript_5528/g.12062 Transcript_5528/m.12062 type:complete len:220 (+) Transcript_5528:1907-2566(+)
MLSRAIAYCACGFRGSPRRRRNTCPVIAWRARVPAWPLSRNTEMPAAETPGRECRLFPNCSPRGAPLPHSSFLVGRCRAVCVGIATPPGTRTLGCRVRPPRRPCRRNPTPKCPCEGGAEGPCSERSPDSVSRQFPSAPHPSRASRSRPSVSPPPGSASSVRPCRNRSSEVRDSHGGDALVGRRRSRSEPSCRRSIGIPSCPVASSNPGRTPFSHRALGA